MAQTIVNKSQAVKDKAGYAGYTFRLEVIMNSYNSSASTYNVTINHYAKGDNATNHKYHGLTTPKSVIKGVAGSTTYGNVTTTVSKITGSETLVATWTGDIQADASGNLNITYSASYNANKSSSYLPATHTISETVNMPRIPRYATITKFEVNKRDETSLTVNWAADVNCNAVQYKIRQSGGSFGNWIGTSGTTFNITGLTANTTYVVQIQVRRTDSGLWTPSSDTTGRQTTYDYPKVTSAPNFIVGNTNTITISNPLHRSCAIYIINPLGTEKGGDTTTGETIPGYNNASWQSFFYNGIPNSTSGLYRVRLVCSEISRDTTVDGGTYSINVNDNKPNADGLTYQYTANLTNLTNNNQTVIDKLSTITLNITNGAIAKNGASITQYIVKWGDTVQDTIEDISQDSAVLGNGSGNKLYVTVYDSRNLNVTKELTLDNFVPYTKPQNLTIALHRRNGIEAISYMDLKGTIYYDKFGSDGVSNQVLTIKYKVNNGSDTYNGTTTGIVYSSQSADNHTQKFSIDDIQIHANGTSGGFSTDSNYTITALITDTSGNTTAVTGTLLSSKFAEDWFQDDNQDYHFGVNGIADEDYTETVHGDLNVIGDFYKDGVLFEGGSGGGGGDKFPIGAIVKLPYNNPDYIPNGWLLCHGQAVSRTEYSDLFDRIGTTWGAGDGSTTFNLPTQAGLVAVGYDSSQTEFKTIGKKGGEKEHTLTIDEMPSHHHEQALGGRLTTTDQVPGAGVIGKENGSNTQNTGGDQPHNNLQPYSVFDFIIKAKDLTNPSQLSDSVPIGAEFEYDGDVVPDGYEEVVDYSTSEIKTGSKWIDGKPIYRKIVTTNNYTLSSSSSAIASGITNVSTLVKFDVSMLYSDGSWFTQWHITDKILRSNGEIRLVADSSATFNKVICILEYTKTS
jgi:microcystin-dependent protein